MAQGAKEILTETFTLENVFTHRLSPHADPSQSGPAPLRPFVRVLVGQSRPEPVKISGKVQRGLAGPGGFQEGGGSDNENATATCKAADKGGSHRRTSTRMRTCGTLRKASDTGVFL